MQKSAFSSITYGSMALLLKALLSITLTCANYNKWVRCISYYSGLFLRLYAIWLDVSQPMEVSAFLLMYHLVTSEKNSQFSKRWNTWCSGTLKCYSLHQTHALLVRTNMHTRKTENRTSNGGVLSTPLTLPQSISRWVTQIITPRPHTHMPSRCYSTKKISKHLYLSLFLSISILSIYLSINSISISQSL